MTEVVRKPEYMIESCMPWVRRKVQEELIPCHPRRCIVLELLVEERRLGEACDWISIYYADIEKWDDIEQSDLNKKDQELSFLKASLSLSASTFLYLISLLKPLLKPPQVFSSSLFSL